MLRTRSYLIPLVALLAGAANAQVTSTIQAISLTANKGQVVTVSTPSPAAQSLTLAEGVATAFDNPFTTTVAWDVTTTTTTVKLVAYFTTASQALSNGTDYIPSSLIEISTDGGANWAPVTGNAVGSAGSAGASFVVYTSAVTSGANKRANASVSFLVRVNLTSNPGLAAGAYAGTLHLMAICN